jgi:hypothetical protein
MAMSKFRKLGKFDPAPSLSHINSINIWNWLNLRRLFPGSTHDDTDDIVCRFASVQRPLTYDLVFNDLNSVDYFPWYTFNTIRELVEKPGIGRVIITRLNKGGKIGEHIDQGQYAKAHTRIHYVLSAGEQSLFHCGNETVNMKAGEIWWFDHQSPHSVENLSNIPRIHCVVDYLGFQL